MGTLYFYALHQGALILGDPLYKHNYVLLGNPNKYVYTNPDIRGGSSPRQKMKQNTSCFNIGSTLSLSQLTEKLIELLLMMFDTQCDLIEFDCGESVGYPILSQCRPPPPLRGSLCNPTEDTARAERDRDHGITQSSHCHSFTQLTPRTLMSTTEDILWF